jgi:hypothetical protein
MAVENFIVLFWTNMMWSLFAKANAEGGGDRFTEML